MSPALLTLVPLFKDSIGKSIEKVAGAGASVITSYGRTAENIGDAIASRIRGGPRP